MNPLQKCPHLFSNGNFEAINKSELRGERTGKIIGHDENSLLIKDGYDRSWYPFRNCTLIARPISDMTYQEIGKVGYKGYNNSKRILKEHCRDRNIFSGKLQYLLSIGVYPFDQSHFEDGTIIDSTKL